MSRPLSVDASTHEQEVHTALRAWKDAIPFLVPSQKNFDRLRQALNTYNGLRTTRVDDGGERLTRSVWLAVFEEYSKLDRDNNVEHGLIHGLLDNGRWRTLFESAGAAYEFVFMVTRFLEDDWNRPFWEDVMRKWVESMHDWVDPGDGALLHPLRIIATGAGFSYTTSALLHPLRIIAVALFGDPWYTLVFAAQEDGTPMSTVVKQTRPPFLPGRLSPDQEQHAYALPELDEGLQAH